MNYTEKYHLPQWEETDRIMRIDFNQMCADVENHLNSVQKEVETAIAKADIAYSPSRKPYVAGYYIGTGKELTINLGFRPTFLVISGLEATRDVNSIGRFGRYGTITDGNTSTDVVKINDDGFTLFFVSGQYPIMSQGGRTYSYIAFR